MPSRWAIYFAHINFFRFLIGDYHLRIYWTDFYDVFTER